MCAITARSNAPRALGPCALSAALLCAFAPSAWALDDAAAVAVAFADTGVAGYSAPQLEISASTMPRFDAGGQQRASRIDMTVLSRKQPALGLSLGLSNLDGPASVAVTPFAPPGPSADIGLHWRSPAGGNYRVEVSAWRHLATPDALEMVLQRQPTYGARVEMQLPSARSSLVADHGFLGMQLESGARITIRRKEHVPMVYYRNQF